MRSIISVSRRTDIPRYYAAWFEARRRAGFARFRNAFGGEGHASLAREDVLGYLFWTKYARPFINQLISLKGEGIPFVFQYTITGYGADLEPNMPPIERVIDDFRQVSALMPAPSCIQWRYDPVVISKRYDSSFHLENFTRIAEALAGATRVVNTSVVEPYAKSVRRIADPEVQFRSIDPARHKQVARRHPQLPQVGAEVGALLRELSEIAARRGMSLRACSNPEWGLPASQCAGIEMFAPYAEAPLAAGHDQLELFEASTGALRGIGALKPSPTRASCRCLKTLDIGMDNTCVAGCKYCYVVSSQALALRNFEAHDPAGEMLR